MDDEPDRAYSRAPELQDLVDLCRALGKEGVRYLLIGGFAVVLHGFVCTTKDIDLDAMNADLVFLDPPYHPDPRRDRRHVGRVCRTLGTRRVTFAVWYSVNASGPPQELADSTGCTGWEVAWPKKDSPVPNYNIDRMPVQEPKGCGILVSDALSELLPDIEESLSAFAARLGWKFSIRHPAG